MSARTPCPTCKGKGYLPRYLGGVENAAECEGCPICGGHGTIPKVEVPRVELVKCPYGCGQRPNAAGHIRHHYDVGVCVDGYVDPTYRPSHEGAHR